MATDYTCCRRPIRIIRAGCIAYQSAWDWQRELVRGRSAGREEDTLLLLEHPPRLRWGARHGRNMCWCLRLNWRNGG